MAASDRSCRSVILSRLVRVVSTAAVCAVLLLASPVAAAEKWTFASSAHFEVYTTANERRAREVLVYFERVHAFFADFLRLEPKPLHPTRLIIFSNAREYEPFKLNEFATAYYAPGPDRDYIVMRSFDAESYPTVVHEYAHLIARHSGASYPPWLNEGLAEFFSTMAPDAGQMSIGRVPLGRLREITVGGPMMDLARLIAVDHRSPEYTSRNHAGMFYAQSWALAHMIMTADGYRQKSGTFINAVATGTPTTDAFAAVYGKSVTAVQGDLQVYVRGERFLYYTARYRDPKASATAPARLVEPFEAGLVTTNLLADRMGRQADARTAYERLAQEKPDDLALLEARALFEWRYNDRDVAGPFLMRAVAAGSRNPAIYRWAAAITSSDDERDALLDRAIGLDPDNMDLRLSRAAALNSRGDAAGAARLLDAITRVTPESAFMYFQVLASVRLRQGDLDQARVAATKARDFADAGREADYANQLLQSIEQFSRRQAEAARAIRDGNSSATSSTPAPTPAGPVGPTGPSTPRPTGTEAVISDLTRELLTVTTGRIRNLTCTSTPPIIEIATAGGVVRLEIDDPLKIRIEGAGGPTTDLACGPQDTRARVGYKPGVNAAQKSVGALRLLDFR